MNKSKGSAERKEDEFSHPHLARKQGKLSSTKHKDKSIYQKESKIVPVSGRSRGNRNYQGGQIYGRKSRRL